MKITITRKQLNQLRNAALLSQRLKSTIVQARKATRRQLVAVERQNAEAITTLNGILGKSLKN